jgi:putative ABC transport system permease protein
MHFYTFVLRNIFRRKVRSGLTLVGVAVAVGAVVALVGISDGFESSFLQLYQERNVDLLVSRKGLMDRLTSGLDERVGEKIGGLPHVKAVGAGLIDMVSLEKLGVIGVMVQGLPIGHFVFEQMKIIEGRNLTAADQKGVLVGKILAHNLHKTVGDTLSIVDEDFTIVGVYGTSIVYENGGMVMLLGTLQRLMGREHQVSGFAVVLDQHDPKTVDQVRQTINALDPVRIEAMPAADFVESTSQIQAAHAMAWMTSAVALVIGTVSMLNTMVMSVFERTREIGILRAMGWRRSLIVRMILLESVILSVAGGAVGTLAALSLTRFLSSQASVAGLISGHISAGVVGEGFVIALLVGLIGAAYPAYRGAQLLPTEAIRHE